MTDIDLGNHYRMRMLMISFICAGIMTVSSSCSKRPLDSIDTEPGVSTKGEDPAIACANKLKKLPFWCRLKKEEHAKINELMNGLGEISSQKTEIIRKVIDLYISDRRSENKYFLEEWSNLYVLNRLVCNVPARESKKTVKFFGGWEDVPYDDKEVSILWPLSIAQDGSLELIGFHPGYNGDEFLALREFDYLLNKYGRRQSKSK